MLIAHALSLSLLAVTAPLSTISEQSGFTRTGRYDEVGTLCKAFEKTYAGKVRCFSFGMTPEQRPMWALAASTDGTLDAATARKKSRPVVLFQGGIHAGEIDGKDAGFWLLRDLLDGKTTPGALSKVTAVFVPVFNVDGHERFGPNNRPNQVGPVEMGWRTTSQNLNLNRDYTKADTPEMAAMLRLLTDWDPILYLDLHVTDGAEFQHDVAVLIEPQIRGPEMMRPLAEHLRVELFKKLETQGHTPLRFYPSFEKDDDPASGFGLSSGIPRFSTAYWPLRNRYAALVETHSWKDYKWRVKTTYDVVAGFLELAAKDGASWLTAAHEADEADKKLAGSTLVLLWDHTDKATTIDFKGYKYRREPSAISGGMRTIYDPKTPQIWKIPLYEELKPVMSATAPQGGYVVTAGNASWMAEKLRLHGLSFTTMTQQKTMSVDAYRIATKKFKPEPYEGHFTVQVTGEWKNEAQEIPAGSLYVPINQRGGRLLVMLMDPAGIDSFLAWGFFNSCMEQKEYMENYVAEEQAVKMMATDAALKAEFEKKLETDPEFVKDAAARLRFFYQRHPSWDARLNLYPVYRVQQAP